MKIAVQLYSLRDVGDLDAQLALARACGFEWVESVAAHDLPADDFAVRLARHGLRAASMHASLALLESQPETIVQACQATGCRLVVMPWLPMGERVCSAAAWSALGARLAAISGGLRAEGLQLAYHNHDFEFLSYEGRTALEWIFDATEPGQLGWEADLGWVVRAGADPWHWLERYGNRLAAVHAKDIAPPGTAIDDDGWATLGEGLVPWARLLPHLASRVELVIFEHDKPGRPETILRNSYRFMAQHLRA